MARLAILSVASIAALTLAGCTSAPEPDDGRLRVVASTNVYGDLAEAIGGDLVTVTSIVSSAAHDPHSYEATVQDQLALSKADLVIENGGGYDPFIDTLLEASSSTPVVLNASEASGLAEGDHDEHVADDDAEDDHGHAHVEGFNEHIWYSPHAMGHVAEHLAEELTKLDPANAAAFERGLAAFTAQLEALEAEAEAIHSANEGATAAITEPVPVYLLEAAGLTNTTPEEFSEAIEEGADVSPVVLRDAIDRVAAASLLAYNSQTASAETEKVRQAAEKAGVPIVEFSETMPEGDDYISWMTANLAAIRAALE